MQRTNFGFARMGLPRVGSLYIGIWKAIDISNGYSHAGSHNTGDGVRLVTAHGLMTPASVFGRQEKFACEVRGGRPG